MVSFIMTMKRDIWVCVSKEEAKILEEYAKARGMLNLSQAVEELVKDN